MDQEKKKREDVSYQHQKWESQWHKKDKEEMLYINFMSAGLIEMAAYEAQEVLSSKSNDKTGQNWHKPVFRPLEISQSIHQIENCLLKKIYWNSVKTE